MNETIWKKISYVIGFVVIGFMFALLLMLANIEIKDMDLWLHLGMGKFIAENGFVPKVDILSHAIAGQQWVNHEWLFQLIVHWVHQASGPDGLIMMQVLLVGLTFAMLFFLGYSKERQLSVVILLILVLYVYKERFTIRPDLFSLLFLTVYFKTLFAYIDRKWAPFALFFIQVLWTNMHGFFIFGPIIVGISLLAEFLKRKTSLPLEWNKAEKLDDDDYRKLKIIFGTVLAACLVNPLFLKGALYPLNVISQSLGESQVFFQHILELKKPILGWKDLFNFNSYGQFKLLILLSFGSFLLNWKKIDIGVFLYWLIFLLFSLTAVRNAVYFAFIGYLVIIINVASTSKIPFWDTINEKVRYMAFVAIQVMLILHIMQYINSLTFNGYFDYETYERKSEFGGVSLKNYPYRAVDFLVENNVKGNFFNDFNSGAYLIGRCFPNIKVFIDGRTELYGTEYYHQYRKAWKGDHDLLYKLVEKYNMTGALLNTIQAPVPQDTIAYFYNKKDWVVVYFDYDGMIFLRDVPENKDVIKKHAIDIDHWEVESPDFDIIRLKHVDPYPNASRAYSLASMGLCDQAMEEANWAMKILPSYRGVYKVMGHCLLQKGDYDEAFLMFRAAKVMDPYDKEVRYNLAIIFEKQEKYERAIEQSSLLVQDGSRNSKVLLLLSRLYVRVGSYPAALEVARAVDGYSSLDIPVLVDIANFLVEEKQNDIAKEFYKIALSIDPTNKQIKKKMDSIIQK